MQSRQAAAPDGAAVRAALWRAMHVQLDQPPLVFEDPIGLRLVSPDPSWRRRGDMNPQATSRSRASAVAHARAIEDLVVERAAEGVGQYVILGAGLDTFAQRRPDVASRLRVFEIDPPGAQAWKRQRLAELGFGIPPWLRLVPAGVAADTAWWERLAEAGFAGHRPAVVAFTGAAMYLARNAVAAALHHIAALAPGSTLAMTFMLPLELVEHGERAAREATETFARAAGTPFLSFFTPAEMQALTSSAGFRQVRHVPASELASRYFAGRPDGLCPSSSEALLIAST
ncbi:MAG: class I SAM-dependent methyltransferase [Pseudomonadota bacterium]